MASCDTANGAIDLSAEGGSGTYTFSWSDGLNTTEDQNGLIAGFYEVTVTDSNGCTATTSIEVENPPVISVTAISNDVLCYGESNGAINVIVSNGTAPFTYIWDNASQMTANLFGLSSGDYTLTVTDANNCSAVTTATIEEPNDIEIIMSASDASCGEANGAIFIAVSGGAGSFSYTWSNGSVLEDPTALLAGVHEVTVTDANNCTATNNIEVQTPNQLTASVIVSDALCNGDQSGSIDLAITGGQMPYTFNWSNGLGVIQNPTNLQAGQYSVTITDDLSCTLIMNAEISEPAAISSQVLTTYESCNNTDGSIDITVIGGTPPYSFEWQDGIGIMEDPVNLNAGTYSVTITDANACEYITSAEVTSSPPYFINAFTTDIACNGEASGLINLNVEGGNPPYTFNWNNGANTEDLSSLSGGQYVVTVSDSEGCTVSYEAEIIEPPLLEAFLIEPINVSCNGLSDGGIVMEVVGGTPGYEFDWNDDNLDGIQNPSGLETGDYEVIITDLNGCQTGLTSFISEPLPLSFAASITNLNCYGGSNGAIDLEVTGGTTPYNFDWNNGVFSIEDIEGIQSGQYDIIITDANGCDTSASYVLLDPDEIFINIENVSDYNGFNISCFGEQDGFVELSATGGALPYNFLWEDGIISNQHFNLTAGDYAVLMTDGNGCTIETQFLLTSPNQINADLEIIDPSCFDENDGQVFITNTSGGIAPYLYALEGDYFSEYDQFDLLSGGVYELYIQDANGCEEPIELEILNPVELNVDLGSETIIQLGDSIQLEPILNIPFSSLDTFIWRPESITTIDPWVRPTESMIYSIQVISENGCIAQDELKVLVKKDRLVYVPNIFTPNNDGSNDLFYPHFGKGVNKINTFRVFDRWGELVFEALDFNPNLNTIGWDGKLKGTNAVSGVYIYLIEVEFADGRVEVYSGDISLIK